MTICEHTAGIPKCANANVASWYGVKLFDDAIRSLESADGSTLRSSDYLRQRAAL